MALDPKLQSGIGFNQPVQQPSFMGGVADLAGLFVDTRTPKGPSEGDKKRAFDQSLNNSLIKAYDEAEQLRAEGFEAQANRRIRRGHLDFARQGGNINSTETQGLIESITGKPAEHSGLSQEEISFNQTIQSTEFQSAFLSTYTSHPEASEDERMNIAFSRVQRSEATAAIIEETKFDWSVGDGQSSRIQAIMDFQKANEGALYVMGKEGRTATQDDVQVALQEFGRLESYITASRPAGISEEEWKPVQNALTQTKEQLKLAERLTGVEEITNDAMLSVFKAIRETEGFSITEQNIAIMFLSRNPEVLQSVGAFSGSTMKDILEMSMKVDVSKVDEQIEAGTGGGVVKPAEGSSAFSEDEFSPHASGSPEQNFKDAASAAKLAGGVKNVVADPEVFSQWVSLTSSGLAALHTMASKNNAWASADGYNKYFTPSFFRTMDEIRFSGNQNAYRALYNKTNEAIDANVTALRANIVSRTDGDFVTYDKASNSLQFDREAFVNSPRIPESEKAAFMRLVETRFDGDFMKAITFRSHDLPNILKISRELNDSNVKQRIDAISQLETVRGRLASPEVLETGGEGDDILEGSAGEDVVQDTDVGGIEPLLGLIDKTEGGGSYDTLFGHSQKGGGTFAGVKPSEMTIGELKRFANPSGKYGQWVKGKVGRVATPMGRYQFVGTTLASTAKKMGLPDSTVFNKNTQDAMFAFKARERLKGKSSPEGKRAAMRAEWEGFKHVSDAELDQAIASFENGAPVDFGGITVATGNTAPQSSPRPQAAESLRTQVADGGEPLQGGSTGGAGGALESSEVSEGGTEVASSENGSGEGLSSKAAEQEWSTLSAQTQTMLERVFGSKEAFIEALISGEVNKEDVA